ncbi:MAG: resolvase [Planctomyces sp.]|nr:resolvase [Planctomyces sp.]
MTTDTVVRCAIYTRKSTEEGLEQEFNSLDAQREAAEAYIASQKSFGWVCLPDRYDDGGFTGGNMERPALKRLLDDISQGRVDCVVVYKVDRMSRSLLDFSKIMGTLEQKGVSFVSVTQHFNTTSSMGRLTLNILLSFAQFERELISERTRDKIAATRRKGKWSGGRPILGYDVVPGGGRIIVNEKEAERVQTIFEMYLDHQSLLETVKALDERGWCSKAWTSRKGEPLGGKPFNKNSLFKLLTNVIYIGKISYKTEIHEGEHPAIVDAELFSRVQRVLKRNGVTGGVQVRNKFGALLKGLLRCKHCDCGMVHSITKRGNKRYRYYICYRAQSRGWNACPSPSVPAAEMERFVIDEIRSIGEDDDVVSETVKFAREQTQTRIKELESEKRSRQTELNRTNGILKDVFTQGNDSPSLDSLARYQEIIRLGEQRMTEIRDELLVLNRQLVDAGEIASACRLFDPLWETLNPREQCRILHMLVQQVAYDGEAGTVAISFHPTGIKSLGQTLQETT